MVPSDFRVVDALVHHGEPIAFEELCRRVMGPRTRYLVLDLDRTTHFGRNLGEMLGWELSAWQSYGDEGLDRMQPRRGASRFAFDWSQPAAVARYLGRAVERWSKAGLYYFWWAKLAAASDWQRRRAFRRHGDEPFRTVQQIPQRTLLRHLEEADPAVLRRLAARVWERLRDDQAITREDLERVRECSPDVEIILTSASPGPTVKHAAEELGVDLCVFSTHERVNSGPAKVERLLELRPDILSRDVETIGVSDTGYGEDHCWTHHFDKVVDVNSSTPFPSIVPAASPLTEVHSALVMTSSERRRLLRGDADVWDPRRKRMSRSHSRLEGPHLQSVLGDVVERLELLIRTGGDCAPEDVAFRVQSLLWQSRQRLEPMLTSP